MKTTRFAMLLFLGMTTGLIGHDEQPVPLPPAEIPADAPVIIQSFAAPIGGGFPGSAEGGVITLQSSGGAFGGVLRAIGPMLGGMGHMSRDQVLMRPDFQQDIELDEKQVAEVKKLQ